MTEWIYQAFICVLVADIAAANEFMFATTGNSADLETFGGAMLSADGASPATHSATMGVLKESYWEIFKAAMDQAGITYTWYLIDNINEILLSTNSGLDIPLQPFNGQDALADLGLEIIEEAV